MKNTKKILIFDNYDSFTYNLTNLLKVVRSNYNFIVKRNKDLSIFDDNFDAIIVSPGPMTPLQTGILKELFETKIIPQKIPYLGICLGFQFLMDYYSIPVKKSVYPIHGNTTIISHEGNDIFTNIPLNFKAARYNSLESTQNEFINSPLLITAMEKDRDAVMGLRHKDLPFCGVQFHPESFMTEYGDQIINNFFGMYLEN